jgi:hypothetical protein
MNDNDLSGSSMSEVENAMCECSVFARGTNLLVYADGYDGLRATYLFTFHAGRCNGSIMRVDFQSHGVVDELMKRMGVLYQHEQVLLAGYGSDYPSYMWFGENTNVHMTQDSGLVEFRKTYAN